MRNIESEQGILPIFPNGELDSRKLRPELDRDYPGICFHSDSHNRHPDGQPVGDWPIDYEMEVKTSAGELVNMMHIHSATPLTVRQIEEEMVSRGNRMVAVEACGPPIQVSQVIYTRGGKSTIFHGNGAWGYLVTTSRIGQGGQRGNRSNYRKPRDSFYRDGFRGFSFGVW